MTSEVIPHQQRRPCVVAVILTYNCAHLVPKAYERIPKDLVDEIIATDDGSKDASHEVAKQLGIAAYRHTPNRGYGGNLKEGLRLALERGADYIVEVHGDGQFDPGAIRAAYSHMEHRRAHLILGSRFQHPRRALDNGMPLVRYLANRGLSFVDRLVLQLPLTEFHTGFRIYSRELLESVPWENNSNDYLFSFQIIAQAAYAGARVSEVPVEADYKGEHTSHSIRGASVYALQTFGILTEFLLSKWGVWHHPLFPARQNDVLRVRVAHAGQPTAVEGRTDACRGCGRQGLRDMFDLGPVPSVNTFLKQEELRQERPYPLRVCWCPHCTLVQLSDIIPSPDLFSQYQHLSSASQSNVRHLQELARLLCERLEVNHRTRIIDVGSNDGSLLAQFRPVTTHLLGIDPAANLVPLAQEKGIEQLPEFLTTSLAGRLIGNRGPYDLVLALNVVAHTPDVNDLLRAVRMVLSPTGTFVMEAVDVFATILRGEFDTVYHEHVYCFSLTALQDLFARAGLTITDVERIPTQGGSLRVFAQRTDGQPEVSPRVAALLQEEEAAGVRRPDIYLQIGEGVRAFRHEFRQKVAHLRATHGRVIGLGAPARGVVILNACAIGTDLMDAVVDDTPLKQGRRVPGIHIPVISWQELTTDHRPAACVLLSWNYKEEVLAKLKRTGHGGEVLVPFPEIHTVTVIVPERVHAS